MTQKENTKGQEDVENYNLLCTVGTCHMKYKLICLIFNELTINFRGMFFMLQKLYLKFH